MLFFDFPNPLWENCSVMGNFALRKPKCKGKLGMTTKSLIALTLAVAIGVANSAFSANLTVAEGNSQTLSNGDSYDAIVVNGTLTIPDGASVSAASLVVATNITGGASVNIEPGGTLAVSGDIHLGYDGGQAHLNVKSTASLTVKGNLYMSYGHTATPASGADPTRAFLTVSNATVTIKGSSGLYLYHGKYWPSATDYDTVVDTVRLEEDGVIKLTGGVVKKGGAQIKFARSSEIVFAGGRIDYAKRGGGVFSHERNAAYTTLHLVSENGSPIHVRGTNASSASYITWFSPGSKSSMFGISGDGDLVLENVNTSDHYCWSGASNWDVNDPNVKFLTGGGIRIIGGRYDISGVYPTNSFSTVGGNCLRSLSIENGAQFDMNGKDAEFVAVQGPLLNTGGDCTLTVGRDGSDIVYPYALPPNVTLSMAGDGDLSLFAADAEAVSMGGGALSLMSRAEIGYPYYKFNVYGTPETGGQNQKARISEFNFLNGTDDVTQGWDAYHYDHTGTSYYNEPTNMWDGSTETDFYDQRAQSWGTVSNILATLEYRPARKVTGYTWYLSGYVDSYNGGRNNRLASYPCAWAVFGSLDNATWTRLDLVPDFEVTDSDPGAWCGTNFVCTYEAPAATTVESITLTSGATLKVAGADVTVSSITGGGLPVALSHGGSLTLPEATEVDGISVDVDAGGGTLVNFRPASDGAVKISGAIGNPRKCVLPVKIETLYGENLQGWKVYLDDTRVDNTTVKVNSDGYLEIFYTGATVLCVR